MEADLAEEAAAAVEVVVALEIGMEAAAAGGDEGGG